MISYQEAAVFLQAFESSLTDPVHLQVRDELKRAYGDCNGTPGRNLDWRASHPVDAKMARNLMRAYVGGYNDFSPTALSNLPDDCMVTLARESSVCVYVKFAGEFTAAQAQRLGTLMKADEIHMEGDLVRFWWD
jgi:hypothetical protein